MHDTDWQKIKYFYPGENWGDPSLIDFKLIWFLDCFRHFINRPIIISSGTQGEHSAQWHEKGLAVDCVVDAYDYGGLNLVLAAMRFPFTGIGVYPKARYDRFIRPLGFHFDIREVNDMPRGVCQAQWVGVPDSNGDNQYYGLNEEILKRWEVI